MKRTPRGAAWRNLMVLAINAALDRQLFSFVPGDNRWDGGTPAQRKAYAFPFEIDGRPALASLRDAGHDEISVHACYLPKPDGMRWVETSNAGFLAGEAFATGWLERQRGAYLQTSPSLFQCRKAVLPILAAITVDPMGFGYRDSGEVIF